MATPGKSIPRASSGIPTPGRPRSTSNAISRTASNPVNGSDSPHDDDMMSRAFADAIRANDPAQHRSGPRISDVSSVTSSIASSASYRPSSVSSVSSAGSAPPPRAKTPNLGHGRPPSRTDVFARSVSRAGRSSGSFEIGDNVRIESLGFEGVLSYLGPIDGKQGHWAGVELSPGFAGKGKNDGSVAGKRYFSCPPNCGVFVATTKLSAPTVGPGAISRPSSVASNYSIASGRATPSVSGRITPSMSSSTYGRVTPSASSVSSNGRMTPASSNGRITPAMSNGRVTPANSTSGRLPSLMKTPVAPSTVRKVTNAGVTPGARTTKYPNMSAAQLTQSPTSARSDMSSPGRNGMSSPGRAGLMNSPSRPGFGSPMNTPKPVPRTTMTVKGRPSVTPKSKVPPNLTMPPPNSTSSPRFPSMPTADAASSLMRSPPKSATQLEEAGRALQDKIGRLVSSASGRETPGSPSMSQRSYMQRSQSSQSWATAPEEMSEEIERLQSRLNALEYENRTLREVQQHDDDQASADLNDAKVKEALAATETVRGERDAAQKQVSELEAQLRSSERTVHERDTKIQGLERSVQTSMADLEKSRVESEARVRGLQEDLSSSEGLLSSLREALAAKDGVVADSDAVVKAKDTELEALQTKLQRTQAELEDERRALGAQIDELREAGQETIALYEERLSIADGTRYELEDALAAAKEELRLRANEPPPSPGTAARRAASAAEIDNEALREQVQHLQKQMGRLEDQLEDARADAENGEAAVEERVKRFKEREESHSSDLEAAKAQIEELMKAEERAKARVLEVEEAVREGAEALENARAEIEVLRFELADLQAQAIGEGGNLGDVSIRSERSHDEVTSLKSQLSGLQESKAVIQQQLVAAQMELEEVSNALRNAEAVASHAKEDKASLEKAFQDLQSKYELERDALLELQERYDDSQATPAATNSSAPSKHDVSAAREEVKGLKLLVQELNQDSHKAQQQIKTLESENKLLTSEMQQLREEIQQLETTLEQSILREEQVLGNTSVSSITGVSALSSGDTSELKAEIQQLKKKLSDTEAKHTRVVHDLNKEITELESLVESKIYREDELERELDTLREAQRKSAKTARKVSKGSSDLGDVPEDRQAPTSTSAPTPASNPSTTNGAHSRTTSLIGSESDVCEICERPGHDIFSCDLLRESSSPTMMMSRINVEDSPGPKALTGAHVAASAPAAKPLYCVDCDSEGHTADECPYALDVF